MLLGTGHTERAVKGIKKRKRNLVLSGSWLPVDGMERHAGPRSVRAVRRFPFKHIGIIDGQRGRFGDSYWDVEVNSTRLQLQA